MKANPAQEKVINNIYGQCIVIACPGSGKTTTLLRRINHMIQEGINPESILMITFTKAAAKEMGDRYASQYQEDSGVTFCTIHALCLAVLKKFELFDLQNLLSNNRDLVMEVIKAHPDSSFIGNLNVFTNDVLNDISVFKNSNMPIQDYIPRCCKDAKLFEEIYERYEREKEGRGVIDYDDLLIRAYKLISTDRDVLDFLRDKYEFIHVDEYQDTNSIQKEFVYAIAGLNGNVTVVGDDDQSIYAFRGARPEVMQDFLKHYPDATEIYMSTNYRSDKSIISAASELVTHNKMRFVKDIQASSRKKGKVEVSCLPTASDEATKIGSDILSFINKGESPDGMAVLYRTNSQSAKIMDVLAKYNIPFYSNEPIPNRYEDEMFYDILAYYKMAKGIGNQNAFIRTITKPNRYFYNYQSMRFDDSMQEMQRKAYDINLESWKNEQTKKNIEKYHKMMPLLRILKPLQFMDAVYKKAGYREYLMSYAEYRNIPFMELDEKWEQYKEDLKRHSISSIEEWEKYAANYTRILDEKQKEKTGVCLSTMHKSKGLEWDKVFITGCVEGICPYEKAKKTEEIEEERRLFYVAMTRAKHELRLYAHNNSSSKKPVRLSRFLLESGLR